MLHIIIFIFSVIIFLFSMQGIVKGLEAISEGYLIDLIESVVSNKFIAIIFGIITTAFLQSSSLVTIIIISLAMTNKIKLIQCLWILLGSNIGTTVTNQLLYLDIKILLPFCFILGLFFIWFYSNYFKSIGIVLISIGLIIISLDLMKYSTSLLAYYDPFLNLLESLNNPIVSLFLGIFCTAILQSSSAAIAITQTIYLNIPIPLTGMWWLIYGQNIGTCFTSLLAGVHSNIQAKRVILLSFLINIFGMILFVGITKYLDFNSFLLMRSPNNGILIANMHCLYNIIAVVLLIPFDKFLVNFTMYLLPHKKKHCL